MDNWDTITEATSKVQNWSISIKKYHLYHVEMDILRLSRIKENFSCSEEGRRDSWAERKAMKAQLDIEQRRKSLKRLKGRGSLA